MARVILSNELRQLMDVAITNIENKTITSGEWVTLTNFAADLVAGESSIYSKIPGCDFKNILALDLLIVECASKIEELQKEITYFRELQKNILEHPFLAKDALDAMIDKTGECK